MKKTTFWILLFFTGLVQAQLTINSTLTPAQLVQNVLVGTGVSPYNITFNGTQLKAATLTEQASRFDLNFSSPIGFPGNSSGVLLTTGKGSVALGPNNSDRLSAPIPAATATEGDADLLTLSGNGPPIRNVSILEFDFVATGLELNFEFVFGSEEYPEYVNSINDVFGFFLSGPGISGTFSGARQAKNIALVPNTTTGISINTVNAAVNNTYFVNNGTGTSPGVNTGVQYDGFTKPIRATSALQCGGVYHIKLAIANVSDNAWDSGVFIKNFTIPPLELLNGGFNTNLSACFGEPIIIESGLTVGSNIFVWTKDGVVIPNEHGASLTVTVGGTYALHGYTPMPGNCLIFNDEIIIAFDPEIITNDPVPLNMCTTLPPPYVFPTINQTAALLGTLTASDFSITYFNSSYQQAYDGLIGLIPTANLTNYTINTPSATIWVRIEDLVGSGCVLVKPFTLNASAAPSGTIGYSATSYCSDSGLQPLTTTLTPGGQFTANPPGLSIDPATGTIDPSLSAANTYTIHYALAASGSCPAFSPLVDAVVTINLTPAAPGVVSLPVTYCQNATTVPLTATGTNLLWYITPSGGVGTATAPTPSTLATGTITYFVSQTINGCEGPRASIVVQVLASPNAPVVTGTLTYCQNGIAPALTATGNNLLWYTVATNGTSTTIAPIPSTAVPGATTYYVSQSSGGCESVRAAITVTVVATPSAPGVSAIGYCQNTTAIPLTATGSNLFWYTTATGNVRSTTAPTPITTVVGTKNYYVSQTISGCEGPRALIAVTISAEPLAPAVSSPLTYCQDASAVALTASGTGLLWYTTATGGVGSATAPTPSTLASGSTTYYVSQGSGICEGPRASIVVDVTPTPAPPIVSTPILYCQNATSVALSATGTSLLWYTVATGGTASATAPTPTTTLAGDTTYYVSQTAGGCESARAALVVTVVAPPLAPLVVSPVGYCQNTTAVALSATGTSLLWYTVATGGTASATVPTPSTSAIGTTSYYVSQTVNGCEGPRATIQVTITAPPLAPTNTVGISYCHNSTAIPLTATGTNLLWYTVATGGVGSATAPTPSTLAPGNFNYYVSQTVNGCEGPRASIAVSVIPNPIAPTVSSPVVYCQNATPAVLTATGIDLIWYTTPTGGTGSIVAPTPTTTLAGTTTYYVSQFVNDCEGPRSAIDVTVVAPPLAPTVTAAIPYCQNTTAVALTATGTNLLWYTVATGGTASAAAPTPSTVVVGTKNYYVSQTVNGCEGPRAVIAVTVSATPIAPTVSPAPVVYCQSATAIALTATGTNLLWYTVATGGTGSATAPTPSTLAAGNTTYYVSQTASICEGPRAALVVTVLPTPTAPSAASPITYCQNTTATALTATGTNLLWYTVATGGTASATAPTPSTLVAGNTTYYVSQTSNGCQGPRAAIVVTVVAPPLAPAVTAAIPYCQNTTAVALTATGTNLLWYTVATGGTASAAAPTPSTVVVGTKNYYVSQTVNGCEGPRAVIAVTVSATPLAPTVSSPVVYCQSATAIALTATGTNLLWYTTATGGTGSATAPTPSTLAAGNTTYYVSQTASICEGPRAALVVTVLPTPTAPSAASPITYCQNNTATALTATGTNLLWYTVATGGTASATAPTPSTLVAGNTTYYVSQTSNGCQGPRAAIVVTVVAPPLAPAVTAAIPYCQNTTAVALTATGTNLLWYTVATGGTASATAPTPSTVIVGTKNYYVSQTVNGCEGPRAVIAVTVSATPIAPTVSSPVVYCQSATAIALTATGTNLLWYTVATGGTGSATAPTPSTLAAGNTTYYVSQTASICEGPRAALVVTVLPTPTAPSATSPITYCQNTTATALTATGTNLLWYTVATGGTASATAPTPSTLVAGNTTYYVSQTSNGCQGPRAAIVVTVVAPPLAPAVTAAIPYCQNTTAVALTATGTNLLWYTVATGGTASAAAPTPSTVIVGTKNYYVSQTVNGCEGPRAVIAVTVSATPLAPTVSAVTYCQKETAVALTATGTNLLWYTTATGGTGSATAPTPSTLAVGNTTYYVSQTTASCEGPKAAIVVKVNPLPIPTLATGGFVCMNSQTNTLLSPYLLESGLSNSLYTFEWFVVTTGIPSLVPGEILKDYLVVAPGVYGVRAKRISTGCWSDLVTTTVGVSAPPVSSIVVTSNYFADLQTITINALPVGSYEYQIDNGLYQNSNVFTNVGSGSHTIAIRDINGCGVPLNTTAYTVDFPKFLTPNGDSFNDTWNIFSLNSQANAKIYIFDRYGKLVNELNPSQLGWDGSFNGTTLPADDYWFTIDYIEDGINKVFKSHFTLKR